MKEPNEKTIEANNEETKGELKFCPVCHTPQDKLRESSIVMDARYYQILICPTCHIILFKA